MSLDEGAGPGEDIEANSSFDPPGPDQAGLVGEDDELASGLRAEFGHGAGGVGLGGGDAHVELVGDVFVGQPRGDEGHHFSLSSGQVVGGRGTPRGSTAGGELGYQSSGDRR